MKKQINKKLTLSKETLRELAHRETAEVAGGLTSGCSDGTSSNCSYGTCSGCQTTRNGC
jgi:hypothetical protein